MLASAKLFGGVWPELLLGFILAGLLEALIPAPALLRWMGSESSGRGILIGSVVGLLLPGGPYLIFPIVADLLRQGAAPGPLIALLTAKALLSPIRMLTYEAPLLGWPMEKIKLPPGFEINVYAMDVPNARGMTLGENGTVFVGTQSKGNVYALSALLAISANRTAIVMR
ncbi:MAG: permease [Nitrospiraceae bacterium]